MLNDHSPFRRRDYVKITLFGFGLTALWQSLHVIVLPVRLLDFVAETQKNTYLGLMTLSGLLLAMFAQPIMGAISDRSTFAWGRRRPFILAGGIAMVLLIPGIVIGIGFLLSLIFSQFLTIIIGLVLGLILVGLASYLFAYIEVFGQTVWTLTYIELSKLKELDVIEVK